VISSGGANRRLFVLHLGDYATFKFPPRSRHDLHKRGYEVTLTPRSGDHGRDVIAVSQDIGCVKIIGSVKAYAPGNLVPYDAVRALIGVMTGEQDVSKGIITTTSDFPPKIADDPFIAPFLPTRLELVPGAKLREWLVRVSKA
jgi:restriction system protein